MKQEPASCLFSDTCHPDKEDDHHHDSPSTCYIHPHRPHQDGYSLSLSSSSAQLNQTRCRKIIPNHDVDGSNSHRKIHSLAHNSCIFNHINKHADNDYSSKRCHRSFSLPILLILLLSMPSIIYPVCAMQKGAAQQQQKGEQLQLKDQLIETEEDPESCRLEDSIPGTPGDDYPTYTDIPETSFRCSDKQFPGYYADVEAECQVFHVCQADGRKDSFLCPVGTIFNQELFVCDWWNNFRCQDAPSFSELNSDLYITPRTETQSNSSLLQKRTNSNYELDNNSVSDDEREREDSVEDEDRDREIFEERISITAAPILARKGLLNQNLQTKSDLQVPEIKGKVQNVKGKQKDIKGKKQETNERQQQVKGERQEVKGRQQEVKSIPQRQEIKSILQRQEVKGKIQQQQQVKGRLQQQEVKGSQEVKGGLKQEPDKGQQQVKGNLLDERTSTTYGTRLSGSLKSSPLTASRTLVENSSDDWDDDIRSTDAITTPEVTTAPTWTFKPTPTTTTTTRAVTGQVLPSRQELRSPAQLRNSVKYERLVGDGKEEFVYWDSRFDNRQQTKSQFQQQVLEQQRQIPAQQQQLPQEPLQQRQQLAQQIKSSRLEVEDKWTPMITADVKSPQIQTTTARSTSRSTPVTPRTAPVTTTVTTTRGPTAARLQKKGGNIKAKSNKLVQTTTTASPTTNAQLFGKDNQQVNERFVYWDSRFGDQQLTQQEQAALEREEQDDRKTKLQQKQDRSGRKVQKQKQESNQKVQQNSDLRSAFEEEWDAISREAEKMKELSSTPPTSTRTAKTTARRPTTTTRVTSSPPVSAAPLLQARKGKLQSKGEIKKSEPLRATDADFDDQPMSGLCEWWHSPDCRDSSSSSSASSEKENLKEEKQGYIAPMQIVSYRTSVNHDDRPSKLTSSTASWETEEEEREIEGESLDDPSGPEERASVTLAPLTNSKRSERIQQQSAAKTNERIKEQSSKVRKQSPEVTGQQRKGSFGGRLVTKAQTKSQKKQRQATTLEDGTSSSRRQTKVTIGPAIVTTSSVPGESEAYTIFKTLKPRAISSNAPAMATSKSTSTSSVTISIRV